MHNNGYIELKAETPRAKQSTGKEQGCCISWCLGYVLQCNVTPKLVNGRNNNIPFAQKPSIVQAQWRHFISAPLRDVPSLGAGIT